MYLASIHSQTPSRHTRCLYAIEGTERKDIKNKDNDDDDDDSGSFLQLLELVANDQLHLKTGSGSGNSYFEGTARRVLFCANLLSVS